MSFTKEQINNMEERPLREQVLIPLFKEMGFKDVYHYDGGIGEKGKDIVMWEEGRINERINYAVVVKSKKISGKASGTNSAGDVCTQIQQVFGRNYPDPITGEERQVKHCYVVSSKEIKKEAEDSILSILERSNLNRLITFIGGDTLWELIDRYLGDRTVLGKLSEIKQRGDRVDPHYRMVPVLKENGILLTVQPKDPKAQKDHPLKFSPYLFAFHNTPEGRAKQEELEQSLKSNSQITLTKEHLEKIGLPEIITRFIDPSTLSDWKVTIGALPPILLTKIIMECADDERVQFDYIVLERFDEEDGTTIYKNEKQLVPWKFEIGLNRQTKPIHLNWKLHNEEVNVNWALQGARFQQALAKGGVLHIKSLETDLPLIGYNIQPNLVEEPDPYWIEILEKLFFIQQKTRTAFPTPMDSIDEDQVRQIFNVAHILETGWTDFVPLPFPLKVTGKAGSEFLLQYFNQEHFPFSFGQEEVVTILSKEVHLGHSIYKMGKVTLSKEDWQTLKLFDETGTPEGGITVTLIPLEDSEMTIGFLNWLPNTETTMPSENQNEV